MRASAAAPIRSLSVAPASLATWRPYVLVMPFPLVGPSSRRLLEEPTAAGAEGARAAA